MTFGYYLQSVYGKGLVYYITLKYFIRLKSEIYFFIHRTEKNSAE